jgi:hypothetical protein
MNVRTAAKILTAIHWRYIRRELIHRPHTVREALSVMSRHPRLVERIACRPEVVHWWGCDCEIKPALVHHRFGDGSFWGTVSPLNTRPDYYLVMGDSSWAQPDAIWDVLETDILPAIEDQYGRFDRECDLYYDELGWPALNDNCGCTWQFPCYRAVMARQYRCDRWYRRLRAS